jgi:hypothetical protein
VSSSRKIRLVCLTIVVVCVCFLYVLISRTQNCRDMDVIVSIDVPCAPTFELDTIQVLGWLTFFSLVSAWILPIVFRKQSYEGNSGSEAIEFAEKNDVKVPMRNR